MLNVSSSHFDPKATTIARLRLRARHFINHDVVVNSTVEFDQRRNGTRLHHRFLSVGSSRSSNSVHGLPSCEDEKFNLVAELTPTQMGPDKSRNLTQLRHNLFAEVSWIRIRIRWPRSSTPLPDDHVNSLGELHPRTLVINDGSFWHQADLAARLL